MVPLKSLSHVNKQKECQMLIDSEHGFDSFLGL